MGAHRRRRDRARPTERETAREIRHARRDVRRGGGTSLPSREDRDRAVGDRGSASADPLAYLNACAPRALILRTASTNARATGSRSSGPVKARSSWGVWKKRCRPASPKKFL